MHFFIGMKYTYVCLYRTILLNLVTLGVLIYFWFSSVDCSKLDFDDQRWLDSELECRPVSALI